MARVNGTRGFAWHSEHVSERRFPWWPSRPKRIAVYIDAYRIAGLTEPEPLPVD